jgi:CheY-like chemotaxis protein
MVSRTGKHPRTILIIDEDLGFLMYLGGVLCKAGYQAWPARDRREAQRLVEELGIDVDLVIAPSGMHTRTLTDALRHHGKAPKLIATEEAVRTGRSRRALSAAAVIWKPSPDEAIQEADWVEAIRAVLD